MLVLGRKSGESVMLGDDIEVRVLEVRGGHVKLGFDAPRSVSICRSELQPDVRQVLPTWRKAECA